MKKLKKKVEKMRDSKTPKAERKALYKALDNEVMNPKKPKDFDPETFDPMEDHPDYELAKRPRELPPKRLPTMGLKPKKIKEGQMVGMYESKQDLYLLIAWLSDRVSDLEKEVKTLRGG